MKNSIERLWTDYEEHHRAAGNKYCHMVGIPLIMVGLLGLLSVRLFRIGTFPVEGALLFVLVIGGIYLSLDIRLGAAMAGASLLLYLGARLLNWKLALGLFVVGWVFQFIGHGVYEKRSPAFYSNFAHLLVGPLWVLNHFVHLRSGQAGSAASVRS